MPNDTAVAMDSLFRAVIRRRRRYLLGPRRWQARLFLVTNSAGDHPGRVDRPIYVRRGYWTNTRNAAFARVLRDAVQEHREDAARLDLTPGALTIDVGHNRMVIGADQFQGSA